MDNSIPDAENKTYSVISKGTYSVTISASGCSSKEDEVVVNSLLVEAKNDTICGTGTADLNVIASGDYSWHAGKDTDDLLASGANYKPTVSQTTTYYVEDAGSISTSVGRTSPGNSTWASWADSYLQQYKFTVSAPVTLKSVKVCANTGGSVVVNLYSSPTALH